MGDNNPGTSADMQKVAVVQRNGDNYDFQITTRPKPIPGPSEVLIKLSATGVCGSDFGLAAGELGPTTEILGHEGVGRVVALGSAVSSSQVQIGQRVGVAWQRDICGSCDLCLTDGEETRCAAEITSGRKMEGTFAEYTVVPVHYLQTLPEGMSDELLAPILCGGVTAYKALKLCSASAGQWIVISGAGGGVGALGVQYAKAMGMRVIAIDAGQEKNLYCMDSGAEIYIDITAGEDAIQQVMAATNGRGVKAVLVATGSSRAYQDAFGMLAALGTLVCIGIPPPASLVNFHPLAFISKGYRVIGSAVGTRGDVLEAVHFVSRGIVKPVVHVIPLEGLPDVVRLHKLGKAVGKYVIRL